MRVSTSDGLCGTVLRTRAKYYSEIDAIYAVAEAGFDAIDLGFGSYGRDGRPFSRDAWLDWVKRRKEACDAAGLPVTQGHAHFYGHPQSRSFTSVDWEEQTQIILRDIEAAAICGIPWLVFHPDTIWDGDVCSHTLSLRRETERFRRFGEEGARRGVGIAIENMRPSRKGEHYFGVSEEDLLELLDALGDDSLFGICWDTGHANLAGIRQEDAIRRIGKRLRALHINDNDGVEDAHQLPYLGTVEWEPLLRALGEIGYTGDFTYEAHNFTRGFSPQTHPDAMRFACTVARRMIALAEEGEYGRNL